MRCGGLFQRGVIIGQYSRGISSFYGIFFSIYIIDSVEGRFRRPGAQFCPNSV